MSSKWPCPRRWFYTLVLGLLFLDLATKQWILNRFHLGESRGVIPGFFHLTYVANDGMAFGLFQGNNLLLGFLACGVLVLAFWMSRNLDWASVEVNLLAAFIVAGAVGNLSDRMRHGHVVDFLDFDLGFYRWPAFNVADSLITVTVCWLVWCSLRGGAKPRPERS
jgi:signal peptidase II